MRDVVNDNSVRSRILSNVFLLAAKQIEKTVTTFLKIRPLRKIARKYTNCNLRTGGSFLIQICSIRFPGCRIQFLLFLKRLYFRLFERLLKSLY